MEELQKTSEFIEMVQQHDLLWNISSKEFKNSEKKAQIWKLIGEISGISGDDAYNKFKSLREKYRREKQKEEEKNRSGAGASRGSDWPHMKELSFLDDCYKRRRATSSNNWKKKDVSEDNQNEQNSSMSLTVPLPSPSPSSTSIGGPPSSPVRVCIPQVSPSVLSQSTSRSAGKNSPLIDKTLTTNTNNLISALKEITNAQRGPYDHVLHFLKATLEQISEDKAKQMEKELMEIAMKYKYN